ncbi:MAG: IclR family transcriptional regulator C-terminal domain-containing protein [Caulobacteraceae bacterium]
MAAAIRLETENRVAALSISCPAFRFPDEKIGEYGGWVRQAAERIGAALASGCRAAKRADGAGIRVERRVRREREQAS